jgi:hypothetical protein
MFLYWQACAPARQANLSSSRSSPCDNDDNKTFDSVDSNKGSVCVRVRAEPRAALVDAVPYGVRGKPRRLPPVLFHQQRTGRHRNLWNENVLESGDDGSNTSRMNVFLFVVVTLPLYLLWFALQVFGVIPMYVRVMVRDSTTRTLNVAAFASRCCNGAA